MEGCIYVSSAGRTQIQIFRVTSVCTQGLEHESIGWAGKRVGGFDGRSKAGTKTGVRVSALHNLHQDRI